MPVRFEDPVARAEYRRAAYLRNRHSAQAKQRAIHAAEKKRQAALAASVARTPFEALRRHVANIPVDHIVALRLPETCGARGCAAPVAHRLPVCGECWPRVPEHVRAELLDATDAMARRCGRVERLRLLHATDAAILAVSKREDDES